MQLIVNEAMLGLKKAEAGSHLPPGNANKGYANGGLEWGGIDSSR